MPISVLIVFHSKSNNQIPNPIPFEMELGLYPRPTNEDENYYAIFYWDCFPAPVISLLGLSQCIIMFILDSRFTWKGKWRKLGPWLHPTSSIPRLWFLLVRFELRERILIFWCGGKRWRWRWSRSGSVLSHAKQCEFGYGSLLLLIVAVAWDSTIFIITSAKGCPKVEFFHMKNRKIILYT